MTKTIYPRSFSYFQVEELPEALSRVLPKYAVPQFLRITRGDVDVTGTFKFQKNRLRREGYNLVECDDHDEVFYFSRKMNRYLKMDSHIYEDIMNKIITF